LPNYSVKKTKQKRKEKILKKIKETCLNPKLKKIELKKQTKRGSTTGKAV